MTDDDRHREKQQRQPPTDAGTVSVAQQFGAAGGGDQAQATEPGKQRCLIQRMAQPGNTAQAYVKLLLQFRAAIVNQVVTNVIATGIAGRNF
ncbi:hypothetical protein D3C81_958950 [compost metagenome]